MDGAILIAAKFHGISSRWLWVRVRIVIEMQEPGGRVASIARWLHPGLPVPSKEPFH